MSLSISIEELSFLAPQKDKWPLILTLVGSNASLASSRLLRWGEQLIHWAALGELGALHDLTRLGLPIDSIDNQGRTPLYWAVEKLYFMKQEQEAGHQIWGYERQVEELNNCVWFLINNGANHINAELDYDPLSIALRTEGAHSIVLALLNGSFLHEKYLILYLTSVLNNSSSSSELVFKKLVDTYGVSKVSSAILFALHDGAMEEAQIVSSCASSFILLNEEVILDLALEIDSHLAARISNIIDKTS